MLSNLADSSFSSPALTEANAYDIEGQRISRIRYPSGATYLLGKVANGNCEGRVHAPGIYLAFFCCQVSSVRNHGETCIPVHKLHRNRQRQAVQQRNGRKPSKA